MEGDLTKETRKSRKKKKREERNLSDEAGWMVFDDSLVVETYLSYIPTHLQQDITQNYPKSQSLELLFLRIQSLGRCCFRRCRVVAGGTNEKPKRGAS